MCRVGHPSRVRTPRPLPPHLADVPFDRSALRLTGMTEGRLKRRDVSRPFRGVQVTSTPATIHEACRAYAVRLRPGQAFSHATAALLHGLPLPARMEAVSPVHVCAVRPHMPPRAAGAVGHRLSITPLVQTLEGLPVCVASEAWCQLGDELTLDEAIVVADHLLEHAPLDEAAARAVLGGRIRGTRRIGAANLLAALEEARGGARSPGETRVRLLLTRAGVPAPELNAPVTDSLGEVLGHADLVWRSAGLVLEYEGDGHRIDRDQFRYDIERYERFRDAGWEVIRVTADDLFGARRAALIERVRRRLRARGVL
ncbi:MAG: hypothetical protein JWQ92_36 [Amnibacterium sp.]|nr:hypothetical protein [Amnibacterium sp.]